MSGSDTFLIKILLLTRLLSRGISDLRGTIISRRGSIAVIQTVRGHTCLPQAGTSGIRREMKIEFKASREKGIGTHQGSIPHVK